PCRGVERRDSEPAWIGGSVRRNLFADPAGKTQAGKAFTKRVEEFIRCRPLPPCARRDRVLVDVHLLVHARRPQPSPPLRGIHDLDERSMSPPGDEKMQGV